MALIKIDNNGEIFIELPTVEEALKININGKKGKYKLEEIRTIGYYGGKTKFQKIFLSLFETMKIDYGCDVFIDAFCGSGMLSLLASKAGYNKIYMNDAQDLVCNYHTVMHDDASFNFFMHDLEAFSYHFPHVDETLVSQQVDSEEQALGHKLTVNEINAIRRELDTEDAEKRREVFNELASIIDSHILESHKYNGKSNIARAVMYYAYCHYNFYGTSSFGPSKPTIRKNMLDLCNTQTLYKNITSITNYYYKKFIIPFLNDEKNLIVLDPPYVTSTRSDKTSYSKHEFTDKKQRYLLEEIRKPEIKARIVLCGYGNSMYCRRFHKDNEVYGKRWSMIKIEKSGSANPNRKEMERIWVNFEFSDIQKMYPDYFEIIPETDWDYKYRR